MDDLLSQPNTLISRPGIPVCQLLPPTYLQRIENIFRELRDRVGDRFSLTLRHKVLVLILIFFYTKNIYEFKNHFRKAFRNLEVL